MTKIPYFPPKATNSSTKKTLYISMKCGDCDHAHTKIIGIDTQNIVFNCFSCPSCGSRYFSEYTEEELKEGLLFSGVL